jgi:hypothetical protein
MDLDLIDLHVGPKRELSLLARIEEKYGIPPGVGDIISEFWLHECGSHLCTECDFTVFLEDFYFRNFDGRRGKIRKRGRPMVLNALNKLRRLQYKLKPNLNPNGREVCFV